VRQLRPVLALAAVTAAALLVPGAVAGPVHLDPGLTVSAALRYDTSPALRDLVSPWAPSPGQIISASGRKAMVTTPGLADPVQQTAASIPARAAVVHNYTGLGNGFDGSFKPDAIPPDTVGGVGRTQYVQWVNSSFAILDKKTGRHLLGPAAGNTLWKGFGGGCDKKNDGDPVVNYDRAADRWVLQQFVATAPYMECLAISKTNDATGAYHRYAFPLPAFGDYPKAGVWSHSYVQTYNMFNGQSGTKVCALERAKMLLGAEARQACVQLAASAPLLLPADIDGNRFPSRTADAPLLGLGTNSLQMYSLHVDWTNVAKTRLSGPTSLPVAAYNPACGQLYQAASRNAAPCAPQPVTGLVGQVALVGLDVLSDRPMFRLAWRKFADNHEAMVVTHAVDALPTTAAALRWYELRRTGTAAWKVHQQGTYLPDGDSRWMASAAMDKSGGIAIGYSVSGPTLTFPSIRIAARTASDPAGQLSKETKIVDGFGEQATASNVARWGDYSAMSVDPVDDCTLWYTTEYMATVGVFDWSTKITAVKLPGC
jgi:hypothetical protein